MLRITDVVDTRPDGRVTWTLKVEGTLNGEWLPELRRAWRCAQEAEAGAAIRVHLVGVRFVDAAGKALLAEMYRAGVEITSCRDPDDLFRQLASQLERVLHFDFAGIVLHDPEQAVVRAAILDVRSMALVHRPDAVAAESAAGLVIQSQ
jgi:hypothetical protein